MLANELAQPAHYSLNNCRFLECIDAAMSPYVGVVRRYFERSDDVRIRFSQARDLLVDFLKIHIRAICQQIDPPAALISVLGGLRGGFNGDFKEGDGDYRTADNRWYYRRNLGGGDSDGATAQECKQGEQPTQVLVKLRVPEVEFYGVVNVQYCFIFCAVVVFHLGVPIIVSVGGRGFLREEQNLFPDAGSVVERVVQYLKLSWWVPLVCAVAVCGKRDGSTVASAAYPVGVANV